MTHAFSLETLLSSPNVAGIEGIRIFDGNRDPWGYDESANYLKHTLCQIEVDRLQAIGNRVDREGEIKSLVREMDTGPQEIDGPELCVLIDEPELHLHPNLQLKVLDYLRVLTSRQRIQVIVATHSPTIVEGATFEELFLLRPIELVQPEDNQLVRVAHDEEKLAALRTLFGSTHNLTSLQPVIVVEGTSDDSSGHIVADRRLYRALHPGFDHATLISGGGKQECVGLAQALQQALTEFSRQLKVAALLDKDIDQGGDGLVKLLPVSMIENLLVDPDVIFAAIESVLERTTFRTVDDVANALDHLLNESEVREVGRRAAAALGASHFYPPSDLALVCEKAHAFILEVQARYSHESLESARRIATKTVEDIRSNERRREEFDGKKALADFFRQHLHSSTLSRQVFTFYAARRARRRRSVVEFFDHFFKELTE